MSATTITTIIINIMLHNQEQSLVEVKQCPVSLFSLRVTFAVGLYPASDNIDSNNANDGDDEDVGDDSNNCNNNKVVIIITIIMLTMMMIMMRIIIMMMIMITLKIAIRGYRPHVSPRCH